MPTVLGDPIQLHQLVMNLCMNAVQAMGANGGRIVVAVAAATVDAKASGPVAELVPGRYIRLSVSDAGPGIDPAVLPRIFDPGFTTKPVGEGTGLGLAVVADIVRTHGGAVTVRSAPGEGATFDVFLPAAPLPDGIGPGASGVG